LIEALVAIAIFSIGFLAVASMQTNALSSTTQSRRVTEAVELATRQAEFLRGIPFYPNYPNTAVTPATRFQFDPDLADGLHEDTDGNYTIRWEITPDVPMGSVANIYTSPLPAPNLVTLSKTVDVTVFETRNPAVILARLELVRVWEQE